MIDLKSLVKAGVHFGHQSSRWCPRMAGYIWGQKNGVHLIDISKTAIQLERASKFLENTIKEGKTVLWIGTKKPAQQSIREAAETSGMPFVTHRWIGGTLTNRSQVQKSVTKFLHLGDVLKKSDKIHYTKKELNSYQKRVDRLEKNIGGIVKMKWPVGALVVVDVRKEQSAVKEARSMNIPVVALVDTNSDPLGIDFTIPANDDAPRSIKILIDYLAQAAQRGKIAFDQTKKEELEIERAQLHDKAPKKKEVKASEKTENTSEVVVAAVEESIVESKETTSKKAVSKPTVTTFTKNAPAKKTVTKK
jgi:small subunit ribosomal protein S2